MSNAAVEPSLSEAGRAQREIKDLQSIVEYLLNRIDAADAERQQMQRQYAAAKAARDAELAALAGRVDDAVRLREIAQAVGGGRPRLRVVQ